MKRICLLIVLAAFCLPAFAQDEEVKHATGFVPSPFSKALKSASAAKHGEMLEKLADVPLPEVYEVPYNIPQQNQGSCGSCWDVSACVAISDAFIGAGMAKGDGSFIMSANTVMWCYSTGGCNGDDASTVMRIAKKDGLPINADVGEYKATGRGPCNKTATRYKIDDWGYADANDDGTTTYAEIKSAIHKFGVCVITVSAGGLVDGERPSTSWGGRTNHQITAHGWDDTKKGDGWSGAILCKNQWGNWGFEHNGQRGYCYLAAREDGRVAAAGSSEVLWCQVNPVAPPTPPTPPVPPVPPTPPVPPVPPVPPAPQQVVTFTIPAYSFTVPGWWGSQTVTVPARTITAPVTEAKLGAANCVDCAQPVARAATARTAPARAAGDCANGSCSTQRSTSQGWRPLQRFRRR
jgi:hypothetical protein